MSVISIEASYDSDWFNEILNHEDIRPYIGLPSIGKLDCNVLCYQPNVLFKVFKDGTPSGFVIFIRTGDDEMEMHTGALKTMRGKEAIEAGSLCINTLLSNSNIKTITTEADPSRKEIAYCCYRLGFHRINENTFELTKG